MKILTAISLLCIAALNARAQITPTASTSASSMSGQFLVLAPEPNSFRPKLSATTNADYLRLEPAFLAIAAERVKEAVWRELGYAGSWNQRVTIILHVAHGEDEPVRVAPFRTMRGWACRVEMPDVVSKKRYMRALVQVVLFDVANQPDGDRAVEIPAWLVEGLSFQLLANNSAELVLGPPKFSPGGVSVKPLLEEIEQVSPLEKAHRILLGETPLTFEQLSWPGPGEIDNARYRASAALFAHQLLNLRSGRECMRHFLSVLPKYLNWQLAFLEGFRPHFSRPLDIEKWWALRASEFAGRDLIQTWPYEESWSKLSAALLQPVNVYLDTNSLPAESSIRLQAVIRDWDSGKRNQALRAKLVELELLQRSVAPELVSLTVAYREAIAEYLKPRKPLSFGKIDTFNLGYTAQRARNEAIARLDALDQELERLRPHRPTMGAATAAASVGQ